MERSVSRLLIQHNFVQRTLMNTGNNNDNEIAQTQAQAYAQPYAQTQLLLQWT